MGGDRLRLFALAASAIVLLVASIWFLDWFTLELGAATPLPDAAQIGIGLRRAEACTPAGVCGSAPMPGHSLYATMGQATTWLGAAFLILIAIQAGSRLLQGAANESATRLGYVLGLIVVGAAFGAGFLFSPDATALEQAGGSLGITVTLERTWAPHLMIVGAVLGLVAIYKATLEDTGSAAIVDTGPALPPARAVAGSPTGAAAPATPARSKSGTVPPPPVPEALRGKVKYAVAAAEITRAGIDARREDGATVLVMWRDVVGVVARRLPQTLDGVPFADLVSTAGSTLRLVPWTRLTGDPLADDGVHRVRAFLALVVERCPSVQLDRATRDYLEQRAPIAQLRDDALLAAHDAKLA